MKVEIGPYPDDDSIHCEQLVDVRIDDWDVWNMETTLAHIVLPMLVKIKQQKMGAPYVDLDDVPSELHPQDHEGSDGVDSTHFARWDYVVDEMIFAFDSLVGEGTEWEDQFWSGQVDFYFDTTDDDSDRFELKTGPGHTLECDMEGIKTYQDRISNGFRLFGKYYQGLWT